MAFPIVCGIPDLRLEPDPYLDLETDRDRARALSESADRLSFRELLESYYAGNRAVTQAQARLYTAGAFAARARSEATLEAWERLSPPRFPGARTSQGPTILLDLGCGHGPLLAAAASVGYAPVGVDIGLRWLVLARKRLHELGVEAQLVCACGEALPFPDSQFDVVAGESVLENTRRPGDTLEEVERVMVETGTFFLSVPNRFSLGPDPQTGMWLGTWLPRGWVAERIKRKGGVPPRRHLFSARSLRSLLGEKGFKDRRMGLPRVPDAVRQSAGPLIRVAIDLFNLVSRVPLLRRILFLFGPTTLVAATLTPTDGRA